MVLSARPLSRLLWRLLFLGAALAALTGAPRAFGADAVEALVQQLPQADYARKQELVQELTRTGDTRVRGILLAWLDGRLLSRPGDDHVFAQDAEGGALRDPLNKAPASGLSADDLNRVGANNQLRKALCTPRSRSTRRR